MTGIWTKPGKRVFFFIFFMEKSIYGKSYIAVKSRVLAVLGKLKVGKVSFSAKFKGVE